MSGRKPRTVDGGPAKFDPAAPAPMPEDAQVRARASRPTFRRGGMVFGDRDWTVIDPEVDEAAQRAILADPVLTIQVKGPDGWRLLTIEERVSIVGASAVDADDTGQAQA